MIDSKTFGKLGPFQQVRYGLLRSESSRIYLLGGGSFGGKGEGVSFLDQVKTNGPTFGYSVPRALILREEYSAIKPQEVGARPIRVELGRLKAEELIGTLKELDFSPELAIRSSAQVEDQIGQTAAGRFATEFHASPLDSEVSKNQFIYKLSRVYNSAYSENALRYWQRGGFTEIPPLSIVIQEVVGNNSEYCPTYFLPALSGIVNTSSRTVVKISTVLGLGLSAVGDAGLGILHKLPILEDGLSVSHNMNYHDGELNTANLFCLDRETGGALQLVHEAAVRLFPENKLDKIRWTFPGRQMGLSGMSLSFEQLLGLPVDIEWASGIKGEPSLVQIRPIQKREIISRPQIKREDKIIQSDDVLGYGEKTISHVIYVDYPHGNVPEEEIKRLCAKYRSNMVIVRTDVTANTNFMIRERIFPYTEVVVVSDYVRGEWHVTGTGMQHFALDLADEGKIFIYTDKSVKLFRNNRGNLIEETDRRLGGMSVYGFDRPIRVAADDAFGWGMVYFG